MGDTFGNRLDELIEQYIEGKNRAIAYENEKIAERNKERERKYMAQIGREKNTKPPGEKSIGKYTREQLMADINEDYHVNLTRQKLSQYIRGEHRPSTELISAFCDFFHVAYEYLCGESTVANPAAARVQEYIKLNDDAIQSLMEITDPTVITVLNALLSDRQSFEHASLNVYEQAYQSYERKHNPNGHGDYDAIAVHGGMANAVLFSRFVEDRLMRFAGKEFEKRLQEQINYEEWRSSHFDEYEEATAAAIPEQKYEGTGTAAVTVLPMNQPPDNK